MKWILQNALVQSPDQKTFTPGMDILIENNTIALVRPHDASDAAYFDRVIDGSDWIVIPGLINAHLHSHDRFDKGRFDAEPLEPWMAMYNTPLAQRKWTPEDCYLRTALNCIDLISSGTTFVIDDVFHAMPLDKECIESVFKAYEDTGMRALVSVAHGDKPYLQSIPFLNDEIPEEYKHRISSLPFTQTEKVLAIWKDLAARWHGRVGFFVSANAPQRCTDSFLKRSWSLAKDLGVPFMVHVLETRVQKATGALHYGKSLVRHMADLGVLSPETVLIHSVWVTDEDIALIADAGAGIVHNPTSNLKLGSGIAPVSKMLLAGIPVGLGTDNNCGNDNADMLEVMKAAALVSRPEVVDNSRWLTARQCLAMATKGGAAIAGVQNHIGSLSPGMRADFIAFKRNTPAFTPLNDPCRQIVYSENGNSLSMVVVDGVSIMEEGKIRTFDPETILRRARERSTDILAMIGNVSREGVDFARHVRRACVKSLECHPTTRSLL